MNTSTLSHTAGSDLTLASNFGATRDAVEVLSRGMQNTLRTGVICEMKWDVRERGIRYQIREVDKVIPTWYAAGDLRHVDSTLGGADA